MTSRGVSETRVGSLGVLPSRCSVLEMTRPNGGCMSASGGTAACVTGELPQLIISILLGM